jgi:hypothetical protein
LVRVLLASARTGLQPNMGEMHLQNIDSIGLIPRIKALNQGSILHPGISAKKSGIQIASPLPKHY